MTSEGDIRFSHGPFSLGGPTSFPQLPRARPRVSWPQARAFLSLPWCQQSPSSGATASNTLGMASCQFSLFSPQSFQLSERLERGPDTSAHAVSGSGDAPVQGWVLTAPHPWGPRGMCRWTAGLGFSDCTCAQRWPGQVAEARSFYGENLTASLFSTGNASVHSFGKYRQSTYYCAPCSLPRAGATAANEADRSPGPSGTFSLVREDNKGTWEAEGGSSHSHLAGLPWPPDLGTWHCVPSPVWQFISWASADIALSRHPSECVLFG